MILDLQAELQELTAIEAESIGWLTLGEGVFLHMGDPQGEISAVIISGWVRRSASGSTIAIEVSTEAR